MDAGQAWAAIRRQRVLVLVTMVLVVLFALAARVVLPTTYTSTAELRFSPAASTVLAGGAGYGSIQLDLYADAVTSPEVLAVAADGLGVPQGQLAATVTAAIVPGTATSHLEITAVTGSPQQAESFANAVGKAYISHVDAQLAEGVAAAAARQEVLEQEQLDALRVLQAKPRDTLATYQLSQTTAQLSQLQLELDAITAAGAPVGVLNSARAAARVGDSLAAMLLIAIGGGLIAGLGVGLLRDQFDDRLRVGDDVADLSGARLIAEFPRAARTGATHARLPAAQPSSAFADSVNALRTTLQTRLLPGSILAVTSVGIGDGKTFVASNLAVAWARSGRSVILVDANLRRPRLHAVFDIAAGEGLPAAVADPDAFASLLVPTLFDRLRVLPSGTTAEEPADLLSLDAFPVLLAHLTSVADVVIVDTPAAGELADAALAAARADATIVVVSPGRTNRRALGPVVRLLRSNGGRITGVVANRWAARALGAGRGPGRRRQPESWKTNGVPATAFAAPGARPVDEADVGTAPARAGGPDTTSPRRAVS